MEIDWERTDLIDEAQDIIHVQKDLDDNSTNGKNGLKVEEKIFGAFKIKTVSINEQYTNNKAGEYVMITCPHLQIENEQQFREMKDHFVEQLKK